MIWVTWRQHRGEGAWVLLGFALVACSIALMTHEARPCPTSIGGDCLQFPTDIAGKIAQGIAQINLVPYALALLPALAGSFIAAPMIAREVENRTELLAWTQGVTRGHWLIVKLALVFVPLLAGAAVVGGLEVILINAQGAHANRWDLFDQQAPLTVASMAFALAVGITAGAIVSKSVPAMAVTLVAFTVTRVGIAEIARPHYMSALATRDPATVAAVSQTSWSLDGGIPQAGAGNHVLSQLYPYQPADRFWTFQVIESAILLGLTALLLGFAVYWVTRRMT